MISAVSDAYSRRAVENVERFASLGAVHPSDRQLVATWADGIEGAVIDAGCGPGHWTNFLTEAGVPAVGVDLVPEFIAHARGTYPGIPFRTGSLDALDVGTGTIGGVLAWYSLIHYEPDTIRAPLLEFSRVLSPGGALLIGFFHGHVVEKFDHAVVPAYQWPVSDLCDELVAAGFNVVETHARTTTGQRSHGAILAIR
ncbi:MULTISPECIES: class I SAM-dependent methyltransferase [unclassified Arthrobacter]|uniref:class I SAM-dependent methyltransferase n=1 Tax=unclassified Arthrobacter TaxID=235627 RepID=UPI002DF8269D|nr:MULTISPECIES: class I SAM-dependent methyltransferase [unclassified Arthrobacter]MEC5193109.1 SAM-dependent methyltransferase [Arthrobacter sp. MP_M4]MEC5204613.1 SAM-dependent methyltransferase [Arthrobacter sp. MP_M7]